MTTTMTDEQTKNSPTHPHENPRGGKYLTFRLGTEEYGVEILKVREINGLLDITAVPHMPLYMKGVINLRGKVIPVIDLRLKFGLNEIGYTEQTCIIVVDIGKEIGVIVDTVSEVLNIPANAIEAPPSVTDSQDTSFILGMGKIGNDVKILLDVDRILRGDEMYDLAHAENDPRPLSQGTHP